MNLNKNTIRQIAALLCAVGILTLWSHAATPEATKWAAVKNATVSPGLHIPTIPPVKPKPLKPVAPQPVSPPPKPNPPDCAQVQCVALTFDDGPSPHTWRLLDELDKAQVKATFFMLGVYVERYADTVRRIANEGHQIGNHTWLHHDLTKMTDTEIIAEIGQTNDIISKIAGTSPTVMRPPFGATDKRVQTLLKLPQIMWNADAYDWRDKDTAATVQRIVSGATPGSIILAHDIYPSTIDAMPQVIQTLRAKGYQFVTVNQLFGRQSKPGVYWSQHDVTIY